MTTDPAVTAAAEAFRMTPFGDDEAMGAAIVAAARPIIEAEVRERIAAEIETECLERVVPSDPPCLACARRARIAMGQS